MKEKGRKEEGSKGQGGVCVCVVLGFGMRKTFFFSPFFCSTTYFEGTPYVRGWILLWTGLKWTEVKVCMRIHACMGCVLCGFWFVSGGGEKNRATD